MVAQKQTQNATTAMMLVIVVSDIEVDRPSASWLVSTVSDTAIALNVPIIRVAVEMTPAATARTNRMLDHSRSLRHFRSNDEERGSRVSGVAYGFEFCISSNILRQLQRRLLRQPPYPKPP